MHCVISRAAVQGMSLRKVTSLGSNSASATDLKRIETPQSLCCDFRGYKTFTTRRQSSSLSPSLSPCWSSGNHSRRLFQKTIEGLEGKINGQALGAALLHGCVCACPSGRTGKHKHRAFPSLWQSLRAATGSLEENMLLLLRY